jgi:hypothetical protein
MNVEKEYCDALNAMAKPGGIHTWTPHDRSPSLVRTRPPQGALHLTASDAALRKYNGGGVRTAIKSRL